MRPPIQPRLVVVPCFTRGVRLAVPEGEALIEDLAVGDLVMTRDNGAQPIRWIGRRQLDAVDLRQHEHLRPIRIRKGALGAGVPVRDLLLSPQHRVLVRSHIAQNLFGTDEVLVAVKQLLQVEGVDIALDVDAVEYFHILFDRHEVVLSDGALTESLYLGQMTREAIGPAALDEIRTLFPELFEDGAEPAAARMLPSGRQARKLAVRHVRNGKPLYA